MHIDHHPLVQDFPELRDALHTLREKDHRFARLCSEYEALDKRICRVEDNVEQIGESELADLKLERVARKDELYRRLKEKEDRGCCGTCHQ